MADAPRVLPITLGQLTDALEAEGVFNIVRYLDAETGDVLELYEDVLAYCRGEREGTDLQLSDTFMLTHAQSVAEEQLALDRGFDEDGLPFGPEDRRYLPLEFADFAGLRGEALARAWLEEHGLEIGDPGE
jgi:hypothetical protein